MSILDTLKQKFPDAILSAAQDHGHDVVVVDRKKIFEVLQFLKNNSECPFEMLLDLCGVDYLGKDPRFEVVYHLYSLSKIKRLRLKVALPESDLTIPSAVTLWEAVNWFEREAFDMFGIHFEGHPNLKRLLMWEEFEGYPLRKDYPIDKRQAIPTLDDIV